MPRSNEASRELSAARDLMERDAAASLALFERAAFLADRVGDRGVQADAELGWGEALFQLDGRESESLVHLNRAAILGEDTAIEALAWLTMGDVWRFYKDGERALSAFGTSATLFMDLDDVTGELIARKALAQLLQALERNEESLPQLQRAVQLSLSDDEPFDCAKLILSLGELLLQLGDKPEAAKVLTVAAEAFHQLGDRRLEVRTRSALLQTSWPRTDYVQLIRLTELQAEQAAEEGNAEMEGKAQLMLARLLEEQASLEGDADG